MLRLLLMLLFCGGLSATTLAAGTATAVVTPATTDKQETVTVTGSDPDPLQTMLGENQHYDIAFLWFKRLATAELSLRVGDSPGTYRAELSARTLGLAAWLTKDRLQRYESVMERDPAGRLRTLTHSSTIYKGKGEKRKGRTKTYTFNYDERLVEISVERAGQISADEPLAMAEGEQPQDILTAFYNFRAGYYGPIKSGRNVSIPTFTRKGPSTILIDILTPSEWPASLKVPAGKVLCRLTLDKEIFKTGGGHVYVWFDATGIPAGGVVEKVLGMGDVRGTLVKEVE